MTDSLGPTPLQTPGESLPRTGEDALGSRAEDFQLALESVRDYAIFLLDPTGHVVSWNLGAEELKGYTSKEIIGKHFSIFYPEEALQSGFPQKELESARTNLRFEDEGWRVRKDGTRFWASVVITAVYSPEGKLRGFAKVTRDLTERKVQEMRMLRLHQELEVRVTERTRALELANAELKVAKEMAVASSQAKSQFLSRMSHELRTPLNAILGFGELLLLQGLGNKDEYYVRQIVSAGKHLLSLINEVLDLARVEVGKMEVSLEPVSVGFLFADVNALMHPLAQQKEVTIVNDSEDAIALFVLADDQKLKQVLINLVSNAIKYNQKGGKVRLYAQEFGSQVRINVQDTGPGIAKEDMEKLFLPFERLSSDENFVEGTGLGLALSRGLAEIMGGTLQVTSELGVGSHFFVELREVPAPCASGGNQETEVAGIRALGKSFRVLAVEDNKANLQLLEHVLTLRPDIRLEVAYTGTSGLELARTSCPELILLDGHLPDMDGYQVLTELQADAATRNIPVVVISADATKSQAKRMLSGGARYYLTKPFDLPEFLRVTDELLVSRTASGE